MPKKQAPIIPPSPATSAVNWTAAATIIAGLATRFGLPIDPQTALDVLTLISIIGPAAIMVWRTFFPGKEATAPQLRAAIAEKSSE